MCTAGRVLRLALYILGGGVAWVGLWQLGTWDHVERFDVWSLVLGLVALATAAPLEAQSSEARSARHSR